MVLREKLEKNDPSEYLNMKHPNNKTSVTASIYQVSILCGRKLRSYEPVYIFTICQGKQYTDKSPEKLLERVRVGNLESSGDSLNNDRYAPEKTSNQARFLTDNNIR